MVNIKKFVIEPIKESHDFDSMGYGIYGIAFNTIYDPDNSRKVFDELRDIADQIVRLELENIFNSDEKSFEKLVALKKIWFAKIRKFIDEHNG